MVDFNRPRPFLRPAAPEAHPAEPGTGAKLIEASARLDEVLRLVDGALNEYRTGADRGHLRDRLLEIRSALRPTPAVPVVPGRSA